MSSQAIRTEGTLNAYCYMKDILKKTTYYIIPSILHSGEGQIIEIINRSFLADGFG